MPPTSQTYLYTTQAAMEDLLSAEGVESRLDDDFSGAASAEEAARIAQARNFATERVNLYVGGLYPDPSVLETSWTAHRWATFLGACHLCKRRGEPVPASLLEACAEVMEEMKAVRDGELVIPDVGQGAANWPTYTNHRNDPRFRLRQVRVQRPISEQSPVFHTQQIDYPAEYTWEF